MNLPTSPDLLGDKEGEKTRQIRVNVHIESLIIDVNFLSFEIIDHNKPHYTLFSLG